MRICCLLALLLGCAPPRGPEEPPTDDDDVTSDDDDAGDDDDFAPTDAVRPSWTAGQVWLVEASRTFEAPKTEGGRPLGLEEAAPHEPFGALVEPAPQTLFWRYEVLGTGMAPTPSSTLFALAQLGAEPGTLAVIRAHLDPTLNAAAPELQLDPVQYLVLREDRDRPAALVVRWTDRGQRITDAWTAGQIDRSRSSIGQSSLGLAPHRLPPWPLIAESGTRLLEHGEPVTVVATDTVQVTFVDALDDAPVTQTWVDGAPWPLLTEDARRSSRLIDDAEAEALLGEVPGPVTHPDDADWTDAVADAVDLDAALAFEQPTAGSTSVELPDDLPWAGSWWSLANGHLVHGHLGGPEALASLIEEDAAPLRAAAQNAGSELISLRWNDRVGTPTWNQAEAEYRGAMEAAQDLIVSFYDTVRDQRDANRIRVEGDDLVGDADWHPEHGAFVIPLAELSPLHKLALMQQEEGNLHGTNPWYAAAWELLNHWEPAGSSWHGHDTGWVASSLLVPEPRSALDVPFGGHGMPLSTADQKGLLADALFHPSSLGWGTRYTEGDATLSPTSVARLLRVQLSERARGLAFDTTAGEQVWNFPAYRYELSTANVVPASSGLILVNLATQAELAASGGISEDQAAAIVAFRRLNGPFQSVAELVDAGLLPTPPADLTVSVEGDLISVSATLRVTFATDGVAASHIDTSVNAPQSHIDSWPFTARLTPDGEVFDASWDNPDDHPDFAWLPLGTTVGPLANPYLDWVELSEYLGL